MTGLHNRRYFDAAAQRLVEHQHDEVLVALIDLDHFKRINDTCGHETGDRVLQRVAERLVDAAPAGAVLFRWGGEEFLLLAPLHAVGESAADITGRLLDRVGDRPIELDAGGMATVSCSIGWESTATFDSGSVREALRRADAHLYEAKQAGRDRMFGPGGETRARGAPGRFADL